MEELVKVHTHALESEQNIVDDWVHNFLVIFFGFVDNILPRFICVNSVQYRDYVGYFHHASFYVVDQFITMLAVYVILQIELEMLHDLVECLRLLLDFYWFYLNLIERFEIDASLAHHPHFAVSASLVEHFYSLHKLVLVVQQHFVDVVEDEQSLDHFQTTADLAKGFLPQIDGLGELFGQVLRELEALQVYVDDPVVEHLPVLNVVCGFLHEEGFAALFLAIELD